ncbi:hypothetical protein [Bacillus cereus]|uniref:hypothetical protein n=1 Tax=Bacillus cereus TaxID=1396 RepID=UPI000BF94FCA|nr:hypothetical protein [Bacillus cereus]PFO53775.1 hypothetical protein COJ71_02295 [Bacillus cereus]
MNIFKLKTDSNEIFNLTVHNYEHQTHKKSPYYDMSGKEGRYYAVCPSCNNPIQIYKLYKDKTEGQGLHARHFGKSIHRLAVYNEERYLACELSNPESFGGENKRKNTKKSNELLALIKEYPDVLFNEIRKISGIGFSYNKFDTMLKHFMKSEGYYYTAINKFNLPYGFLYMQKSVNLYRGFLHKYSPHANEIKEAIQNSKYHTVMDEEIKKNIDDFAALDFYLINHSVKGTTETIELRIVESAKEYEQIIFKKKIPVDKFSFMNKVSKLKDRSNVDKGEWRQRLQAIVDQYIKR